MRKIKQELIIECNGKLYAADSQNTASMISDHRSDLSDERFCNRWYDCQVLTESEAILNEVID